MHFGEDLKPAGKLKLDRLTTLHGEAPIGAPAGAIGFLMLLAGRPRLVGWVSTRSRSFLV